MRLLIYISLLLLAGCSSGIHFTDEEKAYIKETTVKWAVEDNYYPFTYIDASKKPNGISIDYLKLISKKSGLKFEPEITCQVVKCFNSLWTAESNIVTSVMPTPLRSKVALFSRPYIIVNSVLIQRTNLPDTVGIGKGYAIGEYIKNYRATLIIVEFENDELAMQALLAGNIDSVALDEFSANVLKKKYHIDYDQLTLKHVYSLSFAVDKDSKLLRSILDKSISAISDTENGTIINKWK